MKLGNKPNFLEIRCHIICMAINSDSTIKVTHTIHLFLFSEKNKKKIQLSNLTQKIWGLSYNTSQALAAASSQFPTQLEDDQEIMSCVRSTFCATTAHQQNWQIILRNAQKCIQSINELPRGHRLLTKGVQDVPNTTVAMKIINQLETPAMSCQNTVF